MKIQFEFERETKNTIRFTEKLPGDMDSPKIGTLYVAKTALKEIGYTKDANLEVELSVIK
jgi:hypothetical protein